MSYYASFQGRVYLGNRDANGHPIDVRSPGNVADLSLSLKTDVIEHYESQSGQRAVDLRLVKQKSATIALTIEEFTKENLALALYGNYLDTTGGSVTAETVGGTSPVVGDRYFLAHPKVSALTIVDSAATPVTLTAGTHYTADEDFGAVQFLDITGLTPPFKASYTFGAVSEIGLFTQPLPERYLRFEGLNTAAGNAKVLIELYRVAFDPLKKLDIISNDLNKFELEGSLLADASKPYDALLGQFGRIVQIG
ncbi:hypothetical protein [Sulfurivermis fontis]|uniref:phage tail tube protein n=1 Tax=Sulfurivermis fontis TaxID=1972068 RepID=UPI000FDB6F6E|nr:hypothetical protein [Sulfurivermis fontis]